MSTKSLRMHRSFLTVALPLLVLVIAFACNGGTSDTSTVTRFGSEDDHNSVSPVVVPPPVQLVGLTLGASLYGSVAVDCNPNCSGELGWTASVTASPNSGYKFVQWQCSGSCPVGGANTGESISLTINENTHITPIFREIDIASLSIGETSNGRATADCEPNCNQEPPWTVTVTAVADRGYEFDEWNCSGSCPPLLSSDAWPVLYTIPDSSISFTINQDTRITPTFRDVAVPSLNIEAMPNGKAADCEPNCNQEPPWTVTVVADGYEIIDWICIGGSCPWFILGGSSIGFTINQDTRITPVFGDWEADATPNGKATENCEPNCNQEFPWEATVTAVANSGYEIIDWICRGSCPSSVSGAPIRLTIDQNTYITPVFPEIKTASLSSSSIVFTSDRDGNFEIYTMNADGSNVRQITSDNAQDWAPSWSPDGTLIAFESNRNGNFEIYTMKTDGSNVRQITNNDARDQNPSWSPDGTLIAFESNRDGNFEIYTINADGSNVRQVTNNNAQDWAPSWSPDGTQIAFESNRDGNFEIYTINADGSNVRQITTNNTQDQDPSWSPDDNRIAFTSNRDGNFEIYTMDADGSNIRQITNNSATNRAPKWSLDGVHIAFESNRDGNFEIYTINADDSNIRKITNNDAQDWSPSWSPDGTQIAFNSGLDGDSEEMPPVMVIKPTTPPIIEPPVPDRIVFTSNRDGDSEIYTMDAGGSNIRQITNNNTQDSSPSWSLDGTRIVFTSNRDGDWEIYTMDADGSNIRQITNHNARDHNPSWSPDGTQIVFTSNRDGDSEIYTMDAGGSNIRQITNNNARDSSPSWSPDGTQIAFNSNRDGNGEIYTINADGSNIRQITNRSAGENWGASWSPDGTHIAFTSRHNSGGGSGIYTVNAGGSNIRQITNHGAGDWGPHWSPDGTLIAFTSNHNSGGGAEIYIIDADGSNIRQITNDDANNQASGWILDGS